MPGVERPINDDPFTLTQTTMSTTPEANAQRIYMPNVIANSSLTSVKFISACFAGAAAGILGLENWLGFALFLSSTLLTSACIYVINCQGKPSRFLQGGIAELVNPGQDNAFTFVLVWTLFYGLSFTHYNKHQCINYIQDLYTVSISVPGVTLSGLIVHLQCTTSWRTRIPFRCHTITM